MARLGKRLPSPAMVVALVALFVALAGGAYALNVGKGAIKTKNLAKGAVKTKKIANAAVTNAKLAGSAVTTPKLANSAVTPAKAQVAFAKVSPAGVKSNDEKVNSIGHTAASGLYCFDLAFTPEVGVASADSGVNTGVDVDVQIPGNNSCPAGQQDATVATEGASADRGFFVVFY